MAHSNLIKEIKGKYSPSLEQLCLLGWLICACEWNVLQMMTNAMNTSAANANSFNATLKGKINGLEETCKALTEELNFYHTEISTLRDEKQDLE